MAPPPVYPKIDGTIQTAFHLAGPSGPLIRNSSGAIEARDPTNASYAIVRGLTPVGASDLTTKAYVDGLSPIVANQLIGVFTESANTFSDICSLTLTTTAAKPGALIQAQFSGTVINAAAPAQALFQFTINGVASSTTGGAIGGSLFIESGAMGLTFASLGTPGAYAIKLQGKCLTAGTLTIAQGSLGHGACLWAVAL